jgi:hypothetical protein
LEKGRASCSAFLIQDQQSRLAHFRGRSPCGAHATQNVRFDVIDSNFIARLTRFYPSLLHVPATSLMGAHGLLLEWRERSEVSWVLQG